MQAKKPLFWYQGLFLQPQHFQQTDLYFQSLLSPFITYQKPFFWGVCRMNIQDVSLKNRTFELTEGAFILPDGTWIDYPGNAVVQPRSLDKDQLESDKPITVFLGVRKWSFSEENVAVIESDNEVGSVTKRFICGVDAEEAHDLHQGGPTAHVRLMTYVMKIFWDTEIQELGDYHLLPVAKLEMMDGEVQLSPRFIPPTVSLRGSENLLQIMKNIREQVTSRCRLLEEYKSTKELQLAQMESNYIVYLLALRSLNRYVPVLHHLIDAPDVHPWAAYGALSQIIGELSTFTDRINALGKTSDNKELLPKYDHENLWHCFNEAQMLIGELLSAIIIGPENIIDMVREIDLFKARIPREGFDSRNVFYMIIRTDENRDKVLNKLQNVAKVGCYEEMPMLLARALPGIPIEFSLVPPPGLPKRPNSFYFRLDHSHEQWLEIQKSQNICLFWDDAPEDTKAEIVILKR